MIHFIHGETSKKEREHSTQLVEDIQVLCKDDKLIIPKKLQHSVVQ